MFYGGERAARSVRDSVVALDARTGLRRWHFQTVHHDVWDYDPRCAAGAARRRRSTASACPCSRSQAAAGYLYVLDRVTGEPVFDIVETPVPASDVPGERTAADAARAAETAGDRARRLCCRRSRDRHRYDGRARGVLPRVARSQRRLAELGTVHAVSASRAGRGAALDDRVPGLARRRELGRHRGRSRSQGSCSSTRAARAASVGSSRAPRDATSAQTGEGARTERLPYRRTSAVGGPLARFWSHDAAADSPATSRAAASAAWPCQKPPWGELIGRQRCDGRVVWRVPLGLTEQLPESRRRTGRLNRRRADRDGGRARLHRREQRSTLSRVRLADGRRALGHGAAVVGACRADHVCGGRRPPVRRRSSRPVGSR